MRGIYIHIPFCQKKCPYCDFYSLACSQEVMDRYVDAVISCIKSYSQKKISADTIYFGGGTPNLLGAERIFKITDAIFSCFLIAEDCEITLEANPESLSKQSISDFHKAGINRLSLGLQSANPNELISLGRTHTPQQVSDCVFRAKEAAITNISLDLMLGIEGQSEQSLTKSIGFCNDLGVEHISAYILKIEPNTPFHKRRALLCLPDEDESAALYSFTADRLKSLGFEQYEISNFCKNGKYSRHNTKYWKCEEYIGIGPSAHGFFNGERYFYERDLNAFLNNPQKTVFDGLGADAEEVFMLALRLSQGLNLSEFCKRFNLSIPHDFNKKVSIFEKAGLIKSSENTLALTQNGFLVSNSIISDLILSLGL